MEEFFENLKQGRNLITKVPSNRWAWVKEAKEQEAVFERYGGFLENIDKFDPMFFHIAPKDASMSNPQERMMLKVIWELLEDAGYTKDSLNANGSTGLYIGSMYDHYPINGQDGSIQYSGGRRWETVNRCSYFYDFKGPSIAVDCACSTAMATIHMACQSILNGDCDTAIAGAVNLTLHPVKYATLDGLGMLEKDSKSHSMGRGTGYLPCEGIGAVLLKPLAQALKDKDNIYAVIESTGVNHGGTTDGFTIPGKKAEKELILKTLKKCGLKVSDIDFYEVSTTGCRVGDQIEMDVVSELFKQYGDTKKTCKIGSIKTNLGHLEAASGMSQFTKAILQLKYKTLVPSINVDDLYISQLEKSGLVVQEQLEDWNLENREGITAIDSFGAGGSNAFCVVSKAKEVDELNVQKQEYLMVFSSYKVESLRKTVSKMIQYLKKVQTDEEYANANHFSLQRMEYTLQVGRDQMTKRLTIRCRNLSELIMRLDEFEQGIYQNVSYKELTEDECITSDFVKTRFGQSNVELISLWLQGAKIQWDGLYSTKIRKISLPTLNFIEKSYWFQANKKQLESALPESTLPESTLPESSTIKSKIKNCLAVLMECELEEIPEQTRFNDIGIDSLLLIQFASKLSECFDMDIKPVMLYDYFNVEKLANYVTERNRDSKIVLKNKTNEIDARIEKTAIIGMAGRFPKADNLEEFWDNLQRGIDCVTEIPANRWDYRDYYNESGVTRNKSYCKMGGFINHVYDFDTEFFGLTKIEASNMDPQQKVLLEEVWHAFEDGGFTKESIGGSNCGVFIGAGSGDYIYTDVMKQENINAFSLVGVNPSMLAGRISYQFNLKGPAITVDTACSSSLTALHLAINSMNQGECEMAIVAGVNLMHTPMLHIMGAQGEMLSKSGKCQTFSNDADGFVPGEGVGVILLKPLSKAEKSDHKIYAVIAGNAVNEDGLTNGITAPSVHSQQELEENLYRKIGLNPEKIGYVEAHGTGTKLGDPIEVEALTNAYGPFTKKQYCAIGSVKSTIGHSLYCAGIAGLMKAVLCLYHKMLVPTLHANKENEFIDFKNTPFYVNRERKEWKSQTPRIATVSSFGFSGNNVHVVLEEYEQEIKNKKSEDKMLLYTFSARTKQALGHMLLLFVTWLEQKDEQVLMEDVAYTLNTGRTMFEHRVAFIADTKEELIVQIQEFLNQGTLEISLSGTEEKETKALEELRNAYLRGEKISWDQWYGNQKGRIVTLPGYPFQIEYKKAFEVNKEIKEESNSMLKQAVENYIRQVFDTIIGSRAALIPSDETFEQEDFTSLVIREIVNEFGMQFGKLSVSLLYEYTTIDQLVAYFIKECKSQAKALCGNVEQSEDNIEKSKQNGEFLLLEKIDIEESINLLETSNKANKNILVIGDCGALAEKIEQQTKHCTIVEGHCLNQDDVTEKTIKQWIEKSEGEYQVLYFIKEERKTEKIVQKVFNLLKGLIQCSGKNNVQLTCIYKTKHDQVVYVRALAGLLKTFCMEQENITATLVQVEDFEQELLVESLLQEDGKQFEVTYKNHKRYVAFSKEKKVKEEAVPILRKDGVYLITGAKGGIGQRLSEYLAEEPLRTLILTGRSKMEEEEEKQLKEKLGEDITVDYVQADISDEKQVIALMQYIDDTYGRLNGIFHLAGTSNDRLFSGMDWTAFCEVTKAKVNGTVFLEEQAKRFTMDFMVLFSSVAGAFGNVGQGAYAYANAFLTEFANLSKTEGIFSVEWPYWKEGGMKLTQKQKNYFYQENGSMPMPTKEGFDILFQLLLHNHSNVTVLYGNCERMKQKVKHPDLIKEGQVVKERAKDVEESMDIAVIGIDGRYPKAKNLEELWNNLKEGVDCITKIPKDRWDNKRFYSSDRTKENKYYCQYGGFIDDVDQFDSLFFGMAPKDAVYINPQERIMLEVVWHTLEDAGYTQKRLQKEKVGVYMGLTNSDYKFNGFNRGIDEIKPISDPCASVANMISYVLNLDGPSMAIDTMCSSSLASLYVACQALKNGECDAAIVGGANLCMHPQKYMTLCKEGMLSPNGRCKSFGADGDGYVPGEGIGAVLIKPLAKAIQDEDNIYAVIKSCCINHGGHTSGYTVPSPNAQAEVILDAIKRAGIDARTISYVETHGTGTSLGDPIEITGLSKSFQTYTRDVQFCSVGSIKSNIGHLEGASGIASLTKVLLQFKHKQLVPSLYSKETNPEIDFVHSPFFLQQETTDWKPVMVAKNGKEYSIPRRATISGFGAGGTNVNLVVEEYEKVPREHLECEKEQAIILSAKSQESLNQLIAEIITYISSTKDTLLEIAYSLQTTRESMKKRIAFVATKKEEAVEILRAYISNKQDSRIFTGNITLHHKNNFKLNEGIVKKALQQEDMKELIQIWSQGAEIDWSQLYQTNKPSRVKLPFYPFKPDRHRFDEYSICEKETDSQVENIDEIALEELLSQYQKGEVDIAAIKGIIGE